MRDFVFEYPVSIIIKTFFDPKEMDNTLEVIKHQLSSHFKWYHDDIQQSFQVLFGKKCFNNYADKSEIEIHIIQNTRNEDEVIFDDDSYLTGYVCNAAVFAIESTMPLEKHVIISAVTWHKISDYIDPSLVFDGYVYKYPDKGEEE